MDLKNKSSSINVNKYFKKSFSFVFVMVIFLVLNIFIVNNTIVSASQICYNYYDGFENNYYGNLYSNYNFGYNNYFDCVYSSIPNLKIIDNPNQGYCGDGVCNYTNNTENAYNCPEDCYV